MDRLPLGVPEHEVRGVLIRQRSENTPVVCVRRAAPSVDSAIAGPIRVHQVGIGGFVSRFPEGWLHRTVAAHWRERIVADGAPGHRREDSGQQEGKDDEQIRDTNPWWTHDGGPPAHPPD